jgi:hypothetical protein
LDNLHHHVDTVRREGRMLRRRHPAVVREAPSSRGVGEWILTAYEFGQLLGKLKGFYHRLNANRR